MNMMQASTTQGFQVIPIQLSWVTLLRVAVYCELALLIATMIALHDVLAAGLTLILLAGLGLWVFSWSGSGSVLSFGVWGAVQVLLWRIRGETLGLIVLVFLFADMGFYTVTGAATNLVSGADWVALALPALLATFAVTGFVSALVILLERGKGYRASRAAHDFAIAIVFVLIIVLAVGMFTSRRAQAAPRATALKLATENLAYTTTRLVSPSNLVSLSLENRDLFWHTFTIDALNVDLKVPMRATGQIQFDAPSGTYTFHCTIQGHELLGMQGTLMVK